LVICQFSFPDYNVCSSVRHYPWTCRLPEGILEEGDALISVVFQEAQKLGEVILKKEK
jgi:hypothetical protein